MAKKAPSANGSPVTLKTIADALGVSVTTVGRALKNGHRISPEMVTKVQAKADELGYVRNLDAVKLRTGKTYVVMAFLAFSDDEEIGDSGSVGLLHGIHHRFSGTDYSVRAVPVALGESGLEKMREAVKGRNVDGIILDHTEPQDERVRFLLEHDIPFVTFGRTELFSEHSYFDLDNEDAAYQQTMALINNGQRRIALLDADSRYIFSRQRVRGYQRALLESGIPFDENLVKHIKLHADIAKDISQKLIQEQQADAFVCVNELVFLGARAGVRAILGSAYQQIGFSLRSGTNIAAYINSPSYISYYSRLDAGWSLADFLYRRIQGETVESCQRIEKTVIKQALALDF